MSNSEKFLLSKINQLEQKVFELEQRIQRVEGSIKTYTQVSLFESTTGENVKTNTRTEKYLFDGKVYKKSKLVLAVIKKYVENNPNITAEELEREFSSREFNLSTFSCVKEVSSIPEKQLNPVKRYYTDEDSIITLVDGTQMAVCTQWGSNIGLFIEFVKRYGVEIIKINNVL